MSQVAYREIALHYSYTMLRCEPDWYYLIRDWAPLYLGPVVFTCRGLAVATADFDVCRPASHGPGIVWTFTDWHALNPAISASCGVPGARWHREGGDDLPLCCANLQRDLNAYFVGLAQASIEREEKLELKAEPGAIKRAIVAAENSVQLALW